MADTTAYISRPRVSIDGTFNKALNMDVLSVLVEETSEGLYHCEASFNNYGVPKSGTPDFLYFGRDILEFGKTLALWMGEGDQQQLLFKGRISALEADFPDGGSGQILVLAEDRLQDMRMTRRTRTFEDMSDTDILQQIAQEHSLTTDLDLDGPTYKVVAQVNQSDLAFIRERTRSIDAEVWVEDTKLLAKARKDRATANTPLDMAYGVNLLSFSVRADLAHQCTEVGVTGWDVAAKDAIETTADASDITAEMNENSINGSDLLQQALSERKERVVHTVSLTSEEAKHIAQARYRERARRFVTGSGIADGDGRIHVGSVLKIAGLGPLFNGNYYVSHVRHTYDGVYGFRTTFRVERPDILKGAAQ